jgi:sulfur carrier protein
MVLMVNGERQEVAATTVRALLGELDYDGDFLVVAVNHDVVKRAQWDEIELHDGDRVEILTPRQGG